MKTPAIDLAGHAGAAASAAPTIMRKTGGASRGWRVLLGALLLALTPGPRAVASEQEEWPTTPDQGPRTRTKIPWMRFSGDPNAPVVIAGQAAHGHEVVVVREQELTRRERRLLRRAERHAAKAAKLRAKTGTHAPRSGYAVVVPVVQETAPRPVVVEHVRPKVHVVRVAERQEHAGCDESERAEQHEHPREAHAVRIDVERLSADVERQVERALRDAERAHRDAQRAVERAQHRSRR